MYIRRYKIGKRIKSLRELSKQEFIYFKLNTYEKILHKGWWQNWQLRTIAQYISFGYLYKAIPKKWYKKELKNRQNIIDEVIEINNMPF